MKSCCIKQQSEPTKAEIQLIVDKRKFLLSNVNFMYSKDDYIKWNMSKVLQKDMILFVIIPYYSIFAVNDYRLL